MSDLIRLSARFENSNSTIKILSRGHPYTVQKLGVDKIMLTKDAFIW